MVDWSQWTSSLDRQAARGRVASAYLYRVVYSVASAYLDHNRTISTPGIFSPNLHFLPFQSFRHAHKNPHHGNILCFTMKYFVL